MTLVPCIDQLKSIQFELYKITPSSPLKVTLCLGSSCHSRGNRRHVETLRRLSAEGDLEFELTGSLCLGRCSEGPLALFDGVAFPIGPDCDIAALVREHLAARVPS